MSSETYLFIIIIGFVCFIFSLLQPKFCFHFFFFWVLLEGATRKWFFPGIEKPLFLVKYFILTGPFLRYLNSPPKKVPFLPWMLLYVLWGLIEFTNWTATYNIQVFLIGFMIHFWFMSLVFIAPQIFTSREKILSFFRIMIITVIPVLILGTIQFNLPPSHYLNKYVGDNQFISQLGDSGRVRITGTFSYLSYALFLRFYFCSLIVLLLSDNSKRITFLLYISAILGTLNVLMTGARGTVLSISLSLIGIIAMSYSRKNKKWKKMFFQLSIALVIVFSVLIFSSFGKYTSKVMTERFAKTKDLNQRIYQIIIPSYIIKDATIFGYGIGTTYRATQSFVNIRKMGIGYEDFNHRVLLEIGIIGFSIYIIMQLVAIGWMFKQYFKIKNYQSRLFIIFALSNCCYLFFWGFVFSYVDNIAYWFSLALVVSIVKIEDNERFLLQKKLHYFTNNTSENI